MLVLFPLTVLLLWSLFIDKLLFCRHQGPFGTINGFRLGRLPGVHIEWSEINAAWGQVVLLLSSLTKKMDMRFQRYRLVPFGNQSFLESLDDRSKVRCIILTGVLAFCYCGVLKFLSVVHKFSFSSNELLFFSLYLGPPTVWIRRVAFSVGYQVWSCYGSLPRLSATVQRRSRRKQWIFTAL